MFVFFFQLFYQSKKKMAEIQFREIKENVNKCISLLIFSATFHFRSKNTNFQLTSPTFYVFI